MTDVLIITGGSKGIGKAIAEKYASENYTVISISRSKASHVNFQQITADLSNISAAIDAINTVFSTLNLEIISSITLVNNAGRLGEVNTLGHLDSEKIQDIIQLNTTTPLVLSNEFIRFTKSLNCKKQIINISSGAAVNPYQGWSVYCTSKAAIEMMTKTIAFEQNELSNGVKCIAIKPGVVDTSMQAYIRKTPLSDFKNVQRFIDLKENDQLYSPEFVAEKVFNFDTSNSLNNGDIIDIRTV
jgi:benzil reductase ((S)-benzoin forming)